MFIYFFQAILNLFQDERNLQLDRIKTKSTILFLFLSFVAGVHLVGGEFQNFFILRKSFGAHMDMATFYDGMGHLFLFLPILVLIYWTVRVELCQKSTKLLSRAELVWVLFQSLVLSFGLALTVIKSAFIFICLIPISGLILVFLLSARKQKISPFGLYPLYTFFTSLLTFTLVLLFIWLVLPQNFKDPIVDEFVSLPGNYEIKTSLSDVPILKSITKTWP